MPYNLRSGARAPLLEPEEPARGGGSMAGEGILVVRSPQDRALQNEYILAEVMSYLSVTDLNECRLVNQFWNDAATRVIIPKAPIIQFWQLKNKSSLQVGPPNKFTNIMSTSRNIPWKKIFIHGSILDTVPKPYKLQVLPRFFGKVAPFVMYLKIITDFRSLFSEALPKEGPEYPNLKTLKFFFVTPATPEALEMQTVSMIGILRHAPKLQCLSLGFFDGMPDHFFFRILESVPWTQIQHLTLRREMTDADFQRLMEITGTKPELKTFQLKLWRNIDPPTLGTHFHAFLDSQRNTLEILKLESTEQRLEPDFAMPIFPKLKKLHLKLSGWGQASIPDFRASFSPLPQRFPALRTVFLCVSHWIDMELLSQIECPAPVETVTVLKMDHDMVHYYEVRNTEAVEVQIREIVRKIARIFPRVKHLILPANFTVLKAIDLERVWPDVEKLTLICGGRGLADTALTGFSEEECRVVREMTPGTRLFQTVERDVESKIFRFLKQVKVLELDHRVYGHYFDCFTDVGCRLVLLKLENLRCLEVRKHKEFEVTLSDAVIAEMQDKFHFWFKRPKK